jgi:RND family efflux transporter MFP subunit
MHPHRPALIYLAGVGALLITVLGVWGIAARRAARASAETDSRQRTQSRGPRVRVAAVAISPAVRTLVLQGEARPFQTVTLYAKVSGYLTSMRVDKGDRVQAGQLIATIASPELEQQYLGATADARNKRINAERTTALAPAGVVSRQELDSAQASAEVAEATRSSLGSQRDYRNVRAPFDGVVTARFADPGALIQSAANGQSGAVPVVTVSDNDRLRIYVYLDQPSAALVRVGDRAEVRLTERPGWSRVAQVTRVAGELAPRTRTMLTEIDVDNRDGQILAGSYVEVALQVKTPARPEIPVEGLVMRGEKAFVALVDSGSLVHFRPVVVADDDGKLVRLAEGVRAGDRVALSLGNEVEEGARVEVVNPIANRPVAGAAAVGGGGGAPTATGVRPTADPANR